MTDLVRRIRRDHDLRLHPRLRSVRAVTRMTVTGLPMQGHTLHRHVGRGMDRGVPRRRRLDRHRARPVPPDRGAAVRAHERRGRTVRVRQREVDRRPVRSRNRDTVAADHVHMPREHMIRARRVRRRLRPDLDVRIHE